MTVEYIEYTRKFEKLYKVTADWLYAANYFARFSFRNEKSISH